MNNNRKLFNYLVYFVLILFISVGFGLPFDKSPKITSSEISNHIKYLASDQLAGRFPGTEGDELARNYIIKELKNYKILPAGENGFLQSFDYISEIKLGKNNSIVISSIGEISNPGENFIPAYLSASSSAKGNLVFVGYGINAPDLNYSDYNNIDLKGKVAVMLLYSPGYSNPHDNPFSQYERLRIKCAAAKDAGAIGIILIKGPTSGEDELIRLRMHGPGEEVGIPVINIKRDLIEPLFIKSINLNLMDVQTLIDSTRKPYSFEFQNQSAELSVDLIHITSYTNNIIGKIEGKDPVLKNEYILIGAHMDHLGDGLKYGSLHSSHEPEIHNGADDNASGIAGVLELAQYFASIKNSLKRSVIFMFFSAEEAGLIGSAYFTKSELFKKYNIITMINLDMIGRLNDNKLSISGTGTSSLWQHALDSVNTYFNFTTSYNKDGYGPSDHASFYAKDIPVLFFFTGLHKDYHRPSDDWEYINSEGSAKIVNYVASIVNYINYLPSKPDFIKVSSPITQNTMGFRVSLGVIPDYSSSREGLEITGVKAGSIAENAGLTVGDLIIKLGKYEIKNIYDYTDALTKFKPGEETDLTYLRGELSVTVKITFRK